MITKVKFTIAWSIAMVSRGGDSFHQQVQVGYHAHLLGYKGVDLGFRIKAQQIASQLVITRRRKTGCVLTTLHPPNPLVPFHPCHALHPLPFPLNPNLDIFPLNHLHLPLQHHPFNRVRSLLQHRLSIL
jgi:hypothetical protein